MYIALLTFSQTFSSKKTLTIRINLVNNVNYNLYSVNKGILFIAGHVRC